jgi:hypothetical protein
MFNFFLNKNLKSDYSSFPQKKNKIPSKTGDWITAGIMMSCKHKRELYMVCRNRNNSELIITTKNTVN